MNRFSAFVREHSRHPNSVAYASMAIAAVAYPGIVQFATGGNGDALVGLAADAGVYVLLAIGLNVVVGFAGLLDLGYAAFFAIGAYTYGMIASQHFATTPLHHAIHVPFWIALFIAMFVAAGFGALLGAPTLRLRGDYLAIVTLGFGEIVPRVFKNLNEWTGGVNGISALDFPTLPAWIDGPWAGFSDVSINTNFQMTTQNLTSFYVVIVIIIVGCVILVNNLQRSRLGRAWMAVREDETAAAATGINTVSVKLLAFAIGASLSGFAGAFYGAKLSVVSSDQFTFTVSITVLSMVVLGGMGNIPGAMLGGLALYFILYKFLPDAPLQVAAFTNSIGLHSLNVPHGDWPGLGEEVSRLKFIIFGLILVGIMLLRPQGLLPSRTRAAELKERGEETVSVSAKAAG